MRNLAYGLSGNPDFFIVFLNASEAAPSSASCWGPLNLLITMNNWSVKSQRLMFIWNHLFPCEHGKRSDAYSFSTISVIFSSKLVPFPRLGRRWRPKLQGATLTAVLYEPWTLINHHLYLDYLDTVSRLNRRRCVIPLFGKHILSVRKNKLVKKCLSTGGTTVALRDERT